MTGPKILTLDIETAPNLGHFWDLWKQDISISQVRKFARVICLAAKWHHEDEVQFLAEWQKGGHRQMVFRAYKLLDEADVVVHWNGKRFDIPHLKREIALAGFGPPSPFHQVDLCALVKKEFRFASNKLAHITEQFGLSGKMSNSGFSLWTRIEEGDKDARAEMEAYNIQDVVTTEEFYDKILGWISGHPHRGLWVDSAAPVCNKCGGTRLHRRGIATTGVGAFQRYQCQDCKGWSKGGRRINGVDVRGVS